MKRFPAAALVAGLAVLCLEPLPAAEFQNFSYSESGQFKLYGLDSRTRRAFGRASEGLRNDCLAVLRLPQTGHYKYVVTLHGSERVLSRSRPRVRGRVFPLPEGGFRLNLDVMVDEQLDAETFQRELIDLFLLEQMFHPPGRRIKRGSIPPWLSEGTYELVLQRRGGKPSRVYASLIAAREVIPIGELMDAEPNTLKDSLSRGIFQACSAALLKALLDQPEGDRRLKAFLEDLAIDGPPPRALLESHFPALTRQGDQLEKWWALQMASMSRPSAFDKLSAAETEERLVTALTLRFEETGKRGSGGGFLSRFPGRSQDRNSEGSSESQTTLALDEFPSFIERKDANPVLLQVERELSAIRPRAFPLYEPILTRYIATIARLREGKTTGVAEELELLTRERQAVLQRMTEISDHLNWFEATQLSSGESAFSGYENALRRLETLEREAARRNDPVSRYLDTFEREFKGLPESP